MRVYEDRTIKQHYHDEHSGPLEDTVNVKTFVPTTKVGDHVVTDNVGNTETCHPNVYVDKTPPYISYARYGSGASFYKSNCPSYATYTWTDDESGFKEGTVSAWFGSTKTADELETSDSVSVRFWTNASRTSRCSIGSYKFELQGTDNVGNTSSVKVYNYTIVADPPPPEPPPPNSGCSSSKFEPLRVKDSHDCTYYMPVSYDEERCPRYGCKETESLSDLTIKGYGKTDSDAQTDAYDKVRLGANAYAVSMGKSMLSNGDSGDLFIFYNCSISGGDTFICSGNSSGWPISYSVSKSSCTYGEGTGDDVGQRVATCTVKARRCVKYKNGQEYMQNSSTEYTYYCCKTLNSDSHCKVR